MVSYVTQIRHFSVFLKNNWCQQDIFQKYKNTSDTWKNFPMKVVACWVFFFRLTVRLSNFVLLLVFNFANVDNSQQILFCSSSGTLVYVSSLVWYITVVCNLHSFVQLWYGTQFSNNFHLILNGVLTSFRHHICFCECCNIMSLWHSEKKSVVVQANLD